MLRGQTKYVVEGLELAHISGKSCFSANAARTNPPSHHTNHHISCHQNYASQSP
jgi:hypothetical protein